MPEYANITQVIVKNWTYIHQMRREGNIKKGKKYYKFTGQSVFIQTGVDEYEWEIAPYFREKIGDSYRKYLGKLIEKADLQFEFVNPATGNIL